MNTNKFIETVKGDSIMGPRWRRARTVKERQDVLQEAREELVYLKNKDKMVFHDINGKVTYYWMDTGKKLIV